MGVYVRDMEMPESCYECAFRCDNGCDLAFWIGKRIDPFNPKEFMKDRHVDCLLVEVSEPHGDLIDRNEVNNEMLYRMAGTGFQYRAMSVVRFADVVIEAEGE